MARRDDRSNTTPSTADLSANPTNPDRSPSRGASRSRRAGENLDAQVNAGRSDGPGPLGAEPPGPLGTEPLGPGPIGAGAMGPGPIGTETGAPGAGVLGGEPFERRAGAGPRPGPDNRETQGAKEELKGLASQAREQTLRAAGEAKSQVGQLVDQQRHQMADRLRGLASALREAGQRLEERDAGGYGRYAGRAAFQVERASDYLRHQDLNAVVHDLEGLARRRPDLFLGGALLAGLLVARFLKASAEREPWEGYPQSAYANPPYEPYREGYGTRQGVGTGTYGEPYTTTAGGL